MAFERDKSHEELGVDINKKFRVTEGDGSFDKGDILKFVQKGNCYSYIDFFERISDGEQHAFFWKYLEYAEEEPKNSKVKVGEIYRIKNKTKCWTVSHFKGVYIKVIEKEGHFFHYNILDKNKKYVGKCEVCLDEHDLELAKEEKIAIHCKTQEEYNAVAQHMIYKGWKQQEVGDGWNLFLKRTCIKYCDNFDYHSTDAYKNEGYTIKPASYVLGEKLPSTESNFVPGALTSENLEEAYISITKQRQYHYQSLPYLIGWDYGKEEPKTLIKPKKKLMTKLTQLAKSILDPATKALIRAEFLAKK